MSNINKEYNKEFIDKNMMGPNVLKLTEELAKHLPLKSGMRVLDLGCGKALSSIYLAKEYDVTVFATDLWIPASENYKRIQEMGVEDKVFPIHAEAHALPYADDFFDAVISIDSYHYFGSNERYLNDYLARLMKRNAIFAFAAPGFTHELSESELDELQEFNADGQFLSFHSSSWWKTFLERTKVIDVIEVFNLECNNEAWEDWVNCSNPIGQGDKAFFKAVKQLATVGVVAKRNDKGFFLL